MTIIIAGNQSYWRITIEEEEEKEEEEKEEKKVVWCVIWPSCCDGGQNRVANYVRHDSNQPSLWQAPIVEVAY